MIGAMEEDLKLMDRNRKEVIVQSARQHKKLLVKAEVNRVSGSS
jgi:hypothetical protein